MSTIQECYLCRMQKTTSNDTGMMGPGGGGRVWGNFGGGRGKSMISIKLQSKINRTPSHACTIAHLVSHAQYAALWLLNSGHYWTSVTPFTKTLESKDTLKAQATTLQLSHITTNDLD